MDSNQGLAEPEAPLELSKAEAKEKQAISERKLEITSLVREWFFAITMQQSEEVLLDKLAGKFELKFPEATLSNRAGFSSWYQGVKEKFFDQQHLIRHLDINFIDANQAFLVVWVNWQAKLRTQDKPQSEHLDFDAMQLWRVVKEEQGWCIAEYQVVELKNNNQEEKQ